MMDRVENGGIIPQGLIEISKSYQDDFMKEICSVLDEIDVSLMNLEADPSDRDQLHTIFWRFHTIGGDDGGFIR